MQQCRMVEMRYKEVININDGCRLGYVGDVEIRLPEGQVTAIIVPGPCRFFGLFGRGEDYYIPWVFKRCICRGTFRLELNQKTAKRLFRKSFSAGIWVVEATSE